MTLIINEIQRRLDLLRGRHEPTPDILRYREAIIECGVTKVREIEGPPDAVQQWLREERVQLPPGQNDDS